MSRSQFLTTSQVKKFAVINVEINQPDGLNVTSNPRNEMISRNTMMVSLLMEEDI